MPSSKSASAKPVGSCTPFSLEHASQRFTFCIFPSRICVRKTVASLHLQTSHNIFLLDLDILETFNPEYFLSIFCQNPLCSTLCKNRRAGFARHLPESRHCAHGDWSWFSVSDQAPVSFDDRNYLRGGPCEKAFVGHENIVTCDIRVRNFDADFRRDLKHN